VGRVGVHDRPAGEVDGVRRVGVGQLDPVAAGAGGDGFLGKIREILIYTGNISTLSREKIEGYLAWKWGIPFTPNSVVKYTTNESLTRKSDIPANRVTIPRMITTHPFKNVAPVSSNSMAQPPPYTIRWTLDKPFSLVDATTTSALNPNPLSRDHLISLSWKTANPTTWPAASTYRINHVEPTLITDPDTTFFGVANPLIQGGGQKILTNVDGTYSDYSNAIVPYKNKRTIGVEGLKKQKKVKKHK
jgi:hypothetical protein